jgi:hypothetical protein
VKSKKYDMINLTVTQQKSVDQFWNDEAGNTVPYSRVKHSERLNERKLATIARQAIALNDRLKAFKDDVFTEAREMYTAFITENGGKAPGKGKGGITHIISTEPSKPRFPYRSRSYSTRTSSAWQKTNWTTF